MTPAFKFWFSIVLLLSALLIGGLFEVRTTGAGNHSAFVVNKVTGATYYCLPGACRLID